MKGQVSLRRVFVSIALLSGALACGRLAATNGVLAPIEVTAGVLLVATSAGVLFHRPFGFGVALLLVVLLTIAIIIFLFWAGATGRMH